MPHVCARVCVLYVAASLFFFFFCGCVSELLKLSVELVPPRLF